MFMAPNRQPNEKSAAVELAALGNQTRLRIFKLLVRAGHDGMNVGEIQKILRIPASTLAHHLATLSRSGLLQQSQHGREVRCSVDFETMDGLITYLTEQCCEGTHLEGSADVA